MSQQPETPCAAAQERPQGQDFLRARIAQDNESGRFGGRVHTRFPPEPNGYLHIGHAKSICINFGLARDFGGKCNLRFDDTNPVKEDVEYVDSIQQDVRWLGFEWEGEPHYASDYFDRLYAYAEKLIMDGKAYVDELSAEEIREYRGTLTRPGTPSPWRERPASESLDLFRRMKAGEFPDGKLVLRAKIDMASPNVIMRDPTLYRIRHADHHRTGDKWCIYPMYDFTHCISDSIEGITHSICTLEFDNNRELYDWMLDALDICRNRADIGVVVLTGAGDKAFCSGGDQNVKSRGGYIGTDGVPRLNVLDVHKAIRSLPKPVVAMVNGYAIGGGNVLQVVCDLTIASENARFGQTGPKVGSFDAGFGSSYLARCVGQKKAREIWFLCRQYTAREAEQMGMVNKVVPLECLEDETVAWCKVMLSRSPMALRMIKRGLNAELDGQRGLMELAGDATLLYYLMDEAQEGRNAFLEKRDPDFDRFPKFP